MARRWQRLRKLPPKSRRPLSDPLAVPPYLADLPPFLPQGCETMQITPTQWAGIAAAVIGVAVLWGPSAWSFLKSKITPDQLPDESGDEVVDMDYLDLMALRRLQRRAIDLGCPHFAEGLASLQRNFFGCAGDDKN